MVLESQPRSFPLLFRSPPEILTYREFNRYYLNRSQPPLFTRMLHNYLSRTNDTSLLPRALPLIEKEMKWWDTNRTSTFKSPFSGKSHQLARYDVSNTAPRPEGYLEDWETVSLSPRQRLIGY
jgi:alpha,alpha-trehalase